MTREDYLNLRTQENYQMIIVEFYKDTGVFKRDADIRRIFQFLSFITQFVGIEADESIDYFDRKFAIVYVRNGLGQLIGIL